MKSFSILPLLLAFTNLSFAGEAQEKLQWARIEAKTAHERTAIIEAGLSIEVVNEDNVVVLATEQELQKIEKNLRVLVNFPFGLMDFPQKDQNFHNYAELTSALQKLANENADLVSLESAGKSLEGRDIWALTITSNQKTHLDQAGIIFMGGHHAREHLSVEMPLMLAQKLVEQYKAGDARVKKLLDSRSVYILPIVNPDGSEYDIAGNSYRSWRKNRRDNGNGTMGVDLNRNYDHQWGTVGISHTPSSDVYCGKSPFSEPETQTIRDFYESHANINITQSYHTFSQLILYPWGHKYESIANKQDFEIHKTMAETMAKWNGYKPQQGSALYLVSGETGDWSYGTRGIISFTFELDPGSIFQGGFYPGQSYIQPVFNKNWEPALYLIEYTDNPARAIQPEHVKFGLSSPIF